MIVVIQCAARKSPDAGHLRRRDGKPVLFVADPHSAPADKDHFYSRPDFQSDNGVSWRAALLEYNNYPRNNPLGLLPAWKLYQNPTYGRLVDWIGVRNTYILSAGWGLIAAGFLTPDYDITFSPSADAYKRRRKIDIYDDLRMLPANTTEPVVFFGGKDYVNQFCALTEHVKGQRYLFYNSVTAPDAPGCTLKRFDTTTRTNWHYKCAHAFIEGKIRI